MILHIYFIFFSHGTFLPVSHCSRDNSTLRVVSKKEKKRTLKFKRIVHSLGNSANILPSFLCGAQNPEFFTILSASYSLLLYISTKAFFFYSIFFVHTSFNSCKIIYIHLYRYMKEICTTVFYLDTMRFVYY